MFFSIDLNQPHSVVAANSHYYEKPTEPLYINRTLQYHDLIYLIDGEWAFTENEIDYPLMKDDVLLLSAGYHHYTRNPSRADTRTFCIHITSSPNDVAENRNCLMLPPKIGAHRNPVVRGTFENILSTFWSNAPHKQERMSAQLNLLMLYLFDLQDGNTQDRHDLCDNVIRMITENPHIRYRCIDIAEQFNVSTKTIETAMLKGTGMSFTRYQNMRKLEMIKTQMQVEPDIRLAEIAGLFGFYDEFHLSKVFKQIYGVTPTQYKKTLLSDNHID